MIVGFVYVSTHTHTHDNDGATTGNEKRHGAMRYRCASADSIDRHARAFNLKPAIAGGTKRKQMADTHPGLKLFVVLIKWQLLRVRALESNYSFFFLQLSLLPNNYALSFATKRCFVLELFPHLDIFRILAREYILFISEKCMKITKKFLIR